MKTKQLAFRLSEYEYDPDKPLDIRIERIDTTGWREVLNWYSELQTDLDELEGRGKANLEAYRTNIQYFRAKELKLAEREGF